MHKQDMKSVSTLAFGISATLSGTTPSAGNLVDVSDYESATFLFQTGVVTVAGVSGFSVEVQHSDSTAAASFVAVPDSDLIGLESALTVTADTQDNVPIGTIGYRGTRRYVRVVVTGTTNTNAVVNGMWALQNPRYAPPAAVAGNIAAT